MHILLRMCKKVVIMCKGLFHDEGKHVVVVDLIADRCPRALPQVFQARHALLLRRERQQPHQLTLFDSIDKPLDYEKILKESIISCKIR